MPEITVVIDNDGNASQLLGHGPLLLSGPIAINRASHIEPVYAPLRALFHAIRKVSGRDGALTAMTRNWPCLWRVNFAPVDGPILPYAYRDRAEAIDAEISWLDRNWHKIPTAFNR